MQRREIINKIIVYHTTENKKKRCGRFQKNLKNDEKRATRIVEEQRAILKKVAKQRLEREKNKNTISRRKQITKSDSERKSRLRKLL